MNYKVEITYEQRDGSMKLLELEGIYRPTLAVAELFRTVGFRERPHKMVAWDCSSGPEPICIIDHTFPNDHPFIITGG